MGDECETWSSGKSEPDESEVQDMTDASEVMH